MHRFLIIVPDGGMLLEPAGIADILAQANRHQPGASPAPLYGVTIATPHAQREIRGMSGVRLLADCSLADLDPAAPWGTILVTGRGVNEAEGEVVVDWLRRAAQQASRVVSVCGGALLLAQTGLLDGRRATTHWRLLDTLQSCFPRVQVERGPIFVQDGALWTSAGVSSGFDLTLALVEDDHGFTLARDVAQDMVLFLRRPGGQSQFSRALLGPAKQSAPMRQLQRWILDHLSDRLSVERLAEQMAMSPRNFTRVFARETGIPPAKYIEEVRLDAARQCLEQGAEGIEQVALATGFGNGLNLRRVFERNLQITPSEYRERFRARDLA